MAIKWGAWSGVSNAFRVGIDLSVSGTTITAKYYVQSQYAVNDSQTLNRTGAITGSFGYTCVHGSSGGTTLITTSTVGGSRGSTYTFGASISGIYNGASPSVSNATITIPVLAPSTPGTPTIVRNSDTSHTVSWSRVASSDRPLTSQIVQRITWINGSWGSWTSVYTLGTDYSTNGSNNWTDTGTLPDRVYRWRVVGVNNVGVAYSAESQYAFTTPPPPVSATATKLTNGNVRVTWAAGSALNSLEYELERQEDAGSWVAFQIVPGTTLSYDHVSPSAAVTHTYRVRSLVNAPGSLGDNLVSSWNTSNTVQLSAPPNTPTALGPAEAQDAESAITLSWQHNPVDSSEQTEYQIRWRYAGAGTWTELTAVTDSAQSEEFAASTWLNGDTVEWQVRTRGVHATFSPYSATASFVTSTPPTATLVDPDNTGTWDLPTLTVEWTYFDTESTPQSGWMMELLDDQDVVVEERTGFGTATTDSFTKTLPDASSWTVRLAVSDGDGLWSAWVEQAFTVDYPEPVVPVVGALWNPDGYVEVSATNPIPTTEPETVSNDLYRSLDDGQTWELFAQGIPNNGVVSDFESPSVGSIYYKAVAYSALPSAAESTPFELVIARTLNSAGYLSAGPGFTVVGKALYDLKVATSGGRIRTQRWFAGRSSPVEFSGIALSRKLDISFSTLPAEDGPDASLAEEWEQLSDLEGPHLWRDPEGRRVYGSISDIALSPLGGDTYAVSFSLTRTGRR